GISFLVLIGFRSVQPYAPLWVMRQLTKVQEIPPNDDMSRFVFDTPSGFAFDSTEDLVWLNNCYENMGKARRQVHQLAEQTSYAIKNHRRMNDPEVAEQARAIVPHLPKVLLNLSKVRASMTSNTETVVNPVDTPVDPTTRESTTIEENRTLRHVPISNPFFPPGYGPFDNCGAGPSTTRPQGMPFRNNPTVATAAPVYTLPQPTVTQRATQEGQFTVHPEQYYTPGIVFGGPNSIQFGSPIDVERPPQVSEQEEMLKKMKSIEQQMKSMQGLGGHKSVTFKDFCMFPNVHLPPGFKTPKFDKYDGNSDPIAHLKRYCNQHRDQEISHWHIWDDMAQDFVRQFQYNVDIVPDRNTLSNMRKKPNESFREYAIKWREQAARVKPPLDEQELVDIFIEAQDPDYFHHLTTAMGRPFHTAIKIGEMIESGLKTGRIVSQAAIKATTHAIQGGSGSFGNRKRKEEVSSLTSGLGGAQRNSNCPYPPL
ncbi:hypothetical protein MTR67_027770, partial [Solanum verrucosum]